MFASVRSTEDLVAFAATCGSVAPVGVVRKDLDDMFHACHPFHNDVKLQDLASSVVEASCLEAKRDASQALQTYIALRKEDLAQYTRARESILSQYASVLALTAEGDGVGASNRWRLRKAVDARFTASAGVTLDPTASRDVHGNAAGSAFDLGRDGAFDDCKVVIYLQYCSEGLTQAVQRNVLPALRRKGFHVVVVYTAAELLKELSSTSQLWLVSTSHEVLTSHVLETIVSEWRTRGMGVYVLGDNEPYYCDANRLLRQMNLPEMTGNYVGAKHVCASAGSNHAGRVVPGLVTTGIHRLYEGITIAHFDEKTVHAQGGSVVYYNSEGRPSVVAYESAADAGPVIADGAFTKLFVSWDSAGSERLVCNSACYLAAYARQLVQEPEPEPEPSSDARSVNYDFTGAFRGECAITMEDEVPLALLAECVREPPTDDAINNPLAAGAEAARVLSPHAYSFRAAQTFMTGAPDPFRTLTSAEAVFPAVDLSIHGNMQLLATTACQVFFGGKAFPRLAFLMMFSAVDTLLMRGAGNVAMLTFMRNQLLENVKVLRDFGLGVASSAAGAVLAPLCLREAMECFVSNSEMNLLRGPVTAAVMVRTLHATRRDDTVLTELLRRAYVLHVITCVRTASCGVERLRDALQRSCYEHEVGEIPLTGSGRVPASLMATEREAQLCDAALASLYAAADVLKLPHPAGTMALGCAALWACASPQVQASLSAGCSTMRALNVFREHALGQRVWCSMRCSELRDDEMRRIMNSVFKAEFVVETVPLFATCGGCSVLFGISDDGAATPFLTSTTVPPSAQDIQNALSRRRKWLQERYANSTDSGAPTASSDCFALHYNVAKVLSQMPGDLNEEQVVTAVHAIARNIKKDGRGAFAFRGLGGVIEQLIESYLSLRRAGAAEYCDRRPSFSELVAEELRLRSMGVVVDGCIRWVLI